MYSHRCDCAPNSTGLSERAGCRWGFATYCWDHGKRTAVDWAKKESMSFNSWLISLQHRLTVFLFLFFLIEIKAEFTLSSHLVCMWIQITIQIHENILVQYLIYWIYHLCKPITLALNTAFLSWPKAKGLSQVNLGNS